MLMKIFFVLHCQVHKYLQSNLSQPFRTLRSMQIHSKASTSSDWLLPSEIFTKRGSYPGLAAATEVFDDLLGRTRRVNRTADDSCQLAAALSVRRIVLRAPRQERAKEDNSGERACPVFREAVGGCYSLFVVIIGRLDETVRVLDGKQWCQDRCLQVCSLDCKIWKGMWVFNAISTVVCLLVELVLYYFKL